MTNQEIDTLKKTQAELRQALEKYRSIFNTAASLIICVDKNGIVLDCNPRIDDVLGYKPGEVIGQSIEKIIHPNYFKKAKETLIEIVLEGKTKNKEFKMVCKDGTVVDVNINSSALRDDQGQFLHAICILEDITDRKLMEQKVRVSEEKLRMIYHNAGGAIFIANAEDGMITDCNQQAEELLGRTRNEIIEMHQSSIHPPGEEEKYGEKFSYHMQSGAMIDFEGEVQHKDGRRIPVIISAQIKKFEGKDIFIGLFIDISMQRQIERQLNDAQQRAQQYLEITGTMMVVLDREGKISLLNKKACDVLGYRREEVIGKCWFDYFVPQQQRNEILQVFNQLMAGEIELVEYYENPVLTKSGEERTIAWHNALVKEHNGHIIGALSSGSDITHRIQTERKIEQAAIEWCRTFDSIDALIFIMDLENTVIRANDACRKAFALDYQELLGKKCFQLCHKSDQQEELCPCRVTVRENRSYSQEVIFEDDVPRFVTTSPIQDAHGKLLGVVHVAKDISQLKKMEESLLKRIEELEAFKATTVDRENRMIELKQRVNELSEQLGQDPPYDLSFL